MPATNLLEKLPFCLSDRTSVAMVVKNEKQVAHQNRIHGRSRNVICLILLSDVPKAFLYLFPLPGLCYRPAWASACVFPCVNTYVCLLAFIAVKVNSVYRGRFRNINTWCFPFFQEDYFKTVLTQTVQICLDWRGRISGSWTITADCPQVSHVKQLQSC